MSNDLIPVITQTGLAAVFTSTSDGLAARITQIGLGDTPYTADASATALQSEKRRIPVADGERISEHQIHLTGVVDGKGPEHWVHEVGFYLDDGTLFAIWSDPQPLAYISQTVPLLIAFDLRLDALPADSVTVEGTGMNLSLAAWGEQYTANAAAIVDNMARQVNMLFRVQALEKRA